DPPERARAGRQRRLGREDRDAAADPSRHEDTGSEKMSALAFFGNAVAGAGRALGARAWLLAVLALLVPGAVYAQANSIDSMAVSKGASGRTIVRFTLKNAPVN